MEILKVSIKENKKILIFLGVHFLIWVFLFKFVIFPLQGNISEIKEKKEEIKTLVEREKKDLQQIKYLKLKFEKSKDLCQKAEIFIPEDFDIPYLMLSLQALSAHNGMIWENISFGEKISEKEFPLQKLKISLKIVGKYNDFKNFLDALWKNVPIFDIESIRISPTNEEKKLKLYHYSLELFSFAKAPKK